MDLGITIAPNPVKDILHITFETEDASTNVSIYGLNGKLMFNQKADNLQMTIPMEKFRSGTYIVRVTTATNVAVSNIVKQ